MVRKITVMVIVRTVVVMMKLIYTLLKTKMEILTDLLPVGQMVTLI